MKNVEYYMRIDDDSKFKGKFKNVFDIMKTKSGELTIHTFIDRLMRYVD